MTTLILRVFAVPLVALMLVVSLFVLLRGHNAPGGGFIGGLIAAAAFAVQAAAFGGDAVRRAVVVTPMSVAAFGLFAAVCAGLLSAFAAVPFMTGLWVTPVLFGVEAPLSTVMLFDTGVYLVVAGTLTAVVLALEQAPQKREADLPREMPREPDA